MLRFGLLIVVGMMTLGCASSGKVVVQDGYRGIAPGPVVSPSAQLGGLPLAPSSPSEIGFTSSHPPMAP